MDKIFKSLSDANRRKILTILMKKDSTVNEILGFLEIKQPTLSSHLSILKKAGLVNDQIKGKNRVYRLNRNLLNSFVTELNRFVESEIIVRRKIDWKYDILGYE